MPLLLVAPLLLLLATLAVPFAYRFLWPTGVVRPTVFFAVTLCLGILVAAAALFGIADFYVGIGISRPSPSTAAASARVESMFRVRLVTVVALAVAAQYILCYLTQRFLRR
jgi:hypothetical protein